MKNKILPILIIIFSLLALSIVSIYTYRQVGKLSDIIWVSSLPDYYRKLGEGCLKRDDFSCDCLDSVRIMAENNYLLYGRDGCADGYEMNGMLCIGSYSWCEKIK